MGVVVGLEGVGGAQEGGDGFGGGEGARGPVGGAPAAEEPLDGDAEVGGAEGELAEAPLRRLLLELVGEPVELRVEGGAVAEASRGLGGICEIEGAEGRGQRTERRDVPGETAA